MDRQAILDRLKAEAPALRRRYAVRSLALFGSLARGGDHEGSDVDVLVTFEPGRTPGLAFFALQDELSALLGRPVDLNMPASLSPYFRDQVLREAEACDDAG
jgi:predicted nucleotidyltransferase